MTMHDMDGAPLPRARFKEQPEDFVVDEIPAYAPSGAGEHVFVTFRKRRLTTEQAVAAIARALGIGPREAGFAGMKDKEAVTSQTASFPLPLKTDAGPLLGALEQEGLEILGHARHGNKLKPGHLEGNRFDITLRGLGGGDRDRVVQRLSAAARGVPNTFGAQRFGRDGDNPDRALAWLRGAARPPKDRRLQRLLFSSLQALLFNDVLAARVAAGTWRCVLPGDLAKKHDSGGMFLVPLGGAELEDAEARGQDGALSATGPIFGASMRWPEGAPREVEESALARRGLTVADLEAARRLGEGSRRPLRIFPRDLLVEPVEEGVRARFVLPKGAYATTLLGWACELVQGPAAHEEDAAADAGGEASGRD